MQPAVRPFHVYSPGHQPGRRGRVRPRGLPLRPLDARRRRRARPTSTRRRRQDRQLAAAADGVPEPAGVLQQRLGRRRLHAASRRPARSSWAPSDQVGNELDEFVTETLRNNLLGLPLDLPTLNMTRAREAGIPPLNEVRRQIYAETNDGQLAPVHQLGRLRSAPQAPRVADQLRGRLRHAPDDHAGDRRQRIAGKRAAARSAIVDPAIRGRSGDPPADAADFMFSTGAVGNDAERRHAPPVSTTSTCGSAASPRSPTSSAACWAARSTTCSRRSSRSCRTATGSTTWPARRA